jgi:hypothetical protein
LSDFEKKKKSLKYVLTDIFSDTSFSFLIVVDEGVISEGENVAAEVLIFNKSFLGWMLCCVVA